MSEEAISRIPQWTRGDRLGKALDHAGVSIAEMAAYLGVSRNTVGNYIAERTNIDGPALRLWAMRTGVPLRWLETGDGSPSGPQGPAEQTDRAVSRGTAGDLLAAQRAKYAGAYVETSDTDWYPKVA